MEMPDTLDHVFADAKARLAAAASDRNSPMHTPVVATADADARVMVLRHFDDGAFELRFHTDARAPKCAAVTADPRVTMLGYDKDAKIQLRVRGRGRIETDSREAQAAWADSDNFARRCYLAPHPPSSLHDRPLKNLPDDVEGIRPSNPRLNAGKARAHFAILKLAIDEIDWFYLAHEGHRRALWQRDAPMRWVAP